MITEAFFLVAGFELEGYDEFIGSRCVVRAEQIVAHNHNCSRGKGFIRQIILGLALALKSTQYKKLVPNALRFTYQNLKSCKPHEKTKQKTSKY